MWYLLIGLGALLVYLVVMYFYQRKIIIFLKQEEFIEGYRKAQLIDLRERDEYNVGHILGSRNLPLTQIRTRFKELRKDQPIYMYCQNGVRCSRAAMFLKKQGYKEMYVLEGGFKNWTGKIRTK